MAQAEANFARDPTIKQGSSGVAPVRVPPDQASRMAKFLLVNWVKTGELTLPSGARVYGFTSYKNVAQRHDPVQQRKHTLLLTGATVELAHLELPGFTEMADVLLTYLDRKLSRRHALSHAHVLRQSQQTRMSTGFLSHQDLDTNPKTKQSIVVKLTPDAIGESPSRMYVVGAARPFEYGPEAGASGHFDSKLWHASVLARLAA